MVESPQRIWIEADDECPYFYGAHELHDVEQDVIEYVRADLYAALEAKLADLAAENERLKREIAATQEKLIRANDELIQRNAKALSRSEVEAKDKEISELREALEEAVRVKVKPLVWEHHPAGLVASAGGIGEAYIIDTRIARRVYFLKGMDPNRAYPSVEAAKAAAQADYERRILSALEASDERA